MQLKNTRFTWTPKHEEAYEELKNSLMNSPVMSHFDTTRETFILVDASPVGLSAILTQKKIQIKPTRTTLLLMLVEPSLR